jgi:hypothetical protein
MLRQMSFIDLWLGSAKWYFCCESAGPKLELVCQRNWGRYLPHRTHAACRGWMRRHGKKPNI